MVQAQLKTTGIIELINELPVGFDFNGLDARRILKEIRSLRQVAAEQSYMLEGMINALAWRTSEAIENHEKSLRLGSRELPLKLNYAVSLGLLGLYEESLQIYLDLLRNQEIAGRPRDIASALWDAAVTADLDGFSTIRSIYEGLDDDIRKSCHAAESRDAVDAADKLAISVFDVKLVIEHMDSLQHFVSHEDIEARQVKDIAAAALGVARKYKQRVGLSVPIVDSFCGEKIFHIRYVVQSSAENIGDMNDELLSSIAAIEGLDAFEKIVPSFNFGRMGGLPKRG